MTGNGATFHASAPVRLDFAGGWTDVAPFAREEHGVVVNAAIELRSYADLRPGGDCYQLVSEDLGQTLELRGPEALVSNGQLDLMKAALRRMSLGYAALRTRSQVPPGSGLGSSGALDVALVAALDAARGISRPARELAEEAWQLETVDAALAGGKQDQYAAALGGFHQLEFQRDQVKVTPLRLAADFAAELERRIMVCYTGTSRVSSTTIARVMGRYRAQDAEVVSALRTMAEVALEMAEALEASDLGRVARLLTANWRQQQRLDPGMQTPSMARLEDRLGQAGALGGKAAGAGAGGSMFFLLGGPRGPAEAAAREAGATVLSFTWAREGVKVW
jgi:D-glycero-alpha-D-manno-heptose-7-phosphate kinase